MPDIILSIDQGTTGTTVVLLDQELNIRAQGYREFGQIYPQPGWVEHNPDEIWDSVLGAMTAAFSSGDISPADVGAIGITNQRRPI